MRTPTAGVVRHESIADRLVPLLRSVLERPPGVQICFWDGSSYGDPSGGRIDVRSPDAIRRILWSPDELGLARAYVSGELDATGDLADMMRILRDDIAHDLGHRLRLVLNAHRAIGAGGGVGAPPPLPREELVAHGLRHSLHRDRRVVSHHYDVGNAFYNVLLGSSMTYSCARFVDAEVTLAEAQAAKHELISRKLGLGQPVDATRPARLLDVGCGWGSMAMHAAREHGVQVVGVTISTEQAKEARRRVAEASLGDRIEIRVQDYREISDGPFDAISSIGMAEHVGSKQMGVYFGRLHDLLRPGGRLLNHAISAVGGSKLGRRSFVNRYVFPDGELLDVADTVGAMEHAGFEVRDVENLREHYAKTLRCWVDNLEQNWDAAVEVVGEARARVWLLYMSGSINGFEDGRIQLHQTLGVRAHRDGRSDMETTRRNWG